MSKTVLPFKITKTEELITPNSGLTLYLELCKGLGLKKVVEEFFPKPGSGRGFEASAYVTSLLTLFLAGGRSIEDVRKIRLDKALRKIGRLDEVPTSDAIGNWMRRDSGAKNEAGEKLHRWLTARFLEKVPQKKHILDIDAFSIFSEKSSSKMTYKGERGYMPMVGHLADCDWCIGYEFREGNESPSSKNLEIIQKCMANLPTEHEIVAVRIDSAGYQADIFNFLDKEGVKFTITGRHTEPMMAEIAKISEFAWNRLFDADGFATNRQYAESYAQMNETDYFRIVVQRWINPKQDLEGKEPTHFYHIVCTNYSQKEKSAVEVIRFHNGRANSENYYKEAKGGFGLETLPCDDFNANSIWFALSLLAYNLHIFAKDQLFPETWRQKTIASIRWQFIQVAGKIVSHAGAIYLKLAGISDEFLDLFRQARKRCFQLVPI